ncbi:hypothetical protein ABW16_21480 [Mycolicibacter heraklionensis]|uniref:Uncharacterized protein n=1 Tax=Mycolicibacter heraklionensis TaxID=512402 RepID=A0ABR5FA17_9MYCO|nr:hypothetical protein [Mycolicibacter heraklionensis]KLO25887.1 hypothetical protein ABW16_21480 [Mycolicibacter heraklionensis]
MTNTDMLIAVVAQTKNGAVQLARELGLDPRYAFGARCSDSMEGLRVDRVIIDAEADIPERMMHTIRCLLAMSPRRRSQ